MAMPIGAYAASARRCSSGLSQERPLAILSDNDIEHALLALACLHVGIAYVPVSRPLRWYPPITRS
jgi:acyl-CoA synthetase (AMP-forming)/AMP-acid ligase II